ncbi:MAG: glycosyltransferase family 9 protein [Opitutaceae bacterium]
MAASKQHEVTLLAKPHAAPLLNRFAPDIQLESFEFPWTAFQGKYRLWSWPRSNMIFGLRRLRQKHFALGVSARPDPRDHALLFASGCKRRAGFPGAGSRSLLNRAISTPKSPHRLAHWNALAESLGIAMQLDLPLANPKARSRHAVIHTGAGHPVRCWPVERWRSMATRLESAGWSVTVIDDSLKDIGQLLAMLETAERFLGNDSGPGHLAALLGVPTFTLFGPQLPECFSPIHPLSTWLGGAACPYKPCKDKCRFASPECLLSISTDEAWSSISCWLKTSQTHP